MQVGSIDPRLPITLPNLTDKYGRPVSWAAHAVICAAVRFECLNQLVGLAALSVDMVIQVSTAWAVAAATTLLVPITLVFHASAGNCSSTGRCFSAAAWKTTWGRRDAKSSNNACLSRTQPKTISSLSSNP